MRILHVTFSVGRQSGGLGAIALGLAGAQRGLGHDADIWTLDEPEELAWAREQSGLGEAIRALPVRGPRWLFYSPAAERAARAPDDGGRYDVVHQHGIWGANSRITSVWRRAHGRPAVVAPQGSLETFTLRRSAWKKKLALAAWETANLRGACLQATAEAEGDSFRRFGLQGPIAVIPNGVPDSALELNGDGQRFRARHGIPPERRLMLFLSRVHPKKGLPLLLAAQARLGSALDGWDLVIAGMDEAGHEAELRQQIAALGLAERVHFAGPVFGRDKADAFAAAQLFVLPTHSDNFAIVVTEALAARLPVITTRGAPWRSISEAGAGWWTEISVEALSAALSEAAAFSPAELGWMGARGRRLVEEQYLWRSVATQTLELYGWLHGRAARPGFLLT